MPHRGIFSPHGNLILPRRIVLSERYSPHEHQSPRKSLGLRASGWESPPFFYKAQVSICSKVRRMWNHPVFGNKVGIRVGYLPVLDLKYKSSFLEPLTSQVPHSQVPQLTWSGNLTRFPNYTPKGNLTSQWPTTWLKTLGCDMWFQLTNLVKDETCSRGCVHN